VLLLGRLVSSAPFTVIDYSSAIVIAIPFGFPERIQVTWLG